MGVTRGIELRRALVEGLLLPWYVILVTILDDVALSHADVCSSTGIGYLESIIG